MTREEAIELLDILPLCNECVSSNFPYTCAECGDAFLLAMEALKQPEIVRCKDCVYGMMFKNVKDEQRFECVSPTHNGTYVEAHDPGWFCADGERRTDDG